MKAWKALTAISLTSLACLCWVVFGDLPASAEILKSAMTSSNGLKFGDVVVDRAPQSVVRPVFTSTAAYHPSRVALGNASQYTPPDFARIINASQRKEAFYDYLLPMIHKANSEVVLERKWLLSLADYLVEGRSLSVSQLNEVVRIEKRYAITFKNKTPAQRIGQLLLKVDVVPASLIVAQAAKESGWGRSRFATKGNNYFGIWCFYQGCGLKPLRRESGRGHEVATFDSVEQGVRYYVRTINTHVAYDDLRLMRANARKQAISFSGEQLANGLLRYSERGLAYVREVQSMIRYNNLQRFTRIYRV